MLYAALFLSPSVLNAADVPTDKLSKLAPSLKVESPVETPVKDIYRVKIGGQYAYISKDGNYAFIGELLDLESGTSLTRQVQARDNRVRLGNFPENDMIIFPADGDEKGVITVFTDTTCPYCKKLHKEVPAIQKAGISVRYIPFPRGNKKGGGYSEMLSVWCADDKVRAMNIANGIVKEKLEKKECDADRIISAGFDLGIETGVQGTPSVFLASGSKLGGYMPAGKIIESVMKTTPN
jgi:thiol:disulfide interchange protein DsbC